MERRSFLQRAAAANTTAGLCHLFLRTAQAQNPPAAAPPLHVVGSGQDRLNQEHRMGFSTLRFKVLPSETGGGLFLMEHIHLTAGGPPLHLHHSQEEWFYVMEGRVAFQVGDARVELAPGESVLAPRLVPHTFSAVSTTPARLLIGFTPAGKMEQYFRAVSDPAFAKAHLLDAAFFRQHDMELIGPSPFWKKPA